MNIRTVLNIYMHTNWQNHIPEFPLLSISFCSLIKIYNFFPFVDSVELLMAFLWRFPGHMLNG